MDLFRMCGDLGKGGNVEMKLNEEETKVFFKWLDEPPNERQLKISALLDEITHEDEWNMMTENIARNTLLDLIKDIRRDPMKYYVMKDVFKAINEIQEAFKREKIAR